MVPSVNNSFLSVSYKVCSFKSQCQVLVGIIIVSEEAKRMGEEAKIFTLSEVSEHNHAHDCWIVINAKVSFFFLLFLSSLTKDLMLETPFVCGFGDCKRLSF